MNGFLYIQTSTHQRHLYTTLVNKRKFLSVSFSFSTRGIQTFVTLHISHLCRYHHHAHSLSLKKKASIHYVLGNNVHAISLLYCTHLYRYHCPNNIIIRVISTGIYYIRALSHPRHESLYHHQR